MRNKITVNLEPESASFLERQKSIGIPYSYTIRQALKMYEEAKL